ncbi:hypothetical protein SCUP515_00337 [Seiridium cupressi]
MAPKREGSQLMSSKSKQPLIKLEKRENTKLDLYTLPAAPSTKIKKEAVESKPNIQFTTATDSKTTAVKHEPGTKRRAKYRPSGPPCIKVKVADDLYVWAHYDKKNGVVKLRAARLIPSTVPLDTIVIGTLAKRQIYVQRGPVNTPITPPLFGNMFVDMSQGHVEQFPKVDQHGFSMQFNVIPAPEPQKEESK